MGTQGAQGRLKGKWRRFCSLGPAMGGKGGAGGLSALLGRWMLVCVCVCVSLCLCSEAHFAREEVLALPGRSCILPMLRGSLCKGCRAHSPSNLPMLKRGGAALLSMLRGSICTRVVGQSGLHSFLCAEASLQPLPIEEAVALCMCSEDSSTCLEGKGATVCERLGLSALCLCSEAPFARQAVPD